MVKLGRKEGAQRERERWPDGSKFGLKLTRLVTKGCRIGSAVTLFAVGLQLSLVKDGRTVLGAFDSAASEDGWPLLGSG